MTHKFSDTDISLDLKIFCSDCNIQINNLPSKSIILHKYGISNDDNKMCLKNCSHPMCESCIKKTLKRYKTNIGMCDQCMWWEIT